jgi:predicted peptidase
MNIERKLHFSPRGDLPYLLANASGNPPSSPLVVLLHGARDRGSNPEKLLAHGLGRHVSRIFRNVRFCSFWIVRFCRGEEKRWRA